MGREVTRNDRFEVGNPTWVVLNQSETPGFQRLLEALAEDLGPCWIFTGMPWPTKDDQTRVITAPGYDRSSFTRRAVTWSRYTVAALHWGLTLPGDPLILTVTNPPTTPQVAWLLSRLRGFRFVSLVWDVYPDHLVNVGLVAATHPFVKAWSLMNRLAWGEAEEVVTIGEGLRGAIAAQLGARSRPIRIIPNFAETEVIAPVPKQGNDFAQREGLVERLTVLYSGNIGATHELKTMIDAADALREAADVAFLIIGDGAGRGRLEVECRDRRLEHVRLLRPLSWDEFPMAAAAGDLAVVVQAPGSEHLSVPSKTYTALAAGSGIIAVTSKTSDLARLVMEHDVGHVVEHGDVAGFVEVVERYRREPMELAALRRRSRRVAEQTFSEDVVRRQWLDVLDPLVSCRRRDALS